MAVIGFLPRFMTFPAIVSCLGLQYRNQFFPINLSLMTIRQFLVTPNISVPPCTFDISCQDGYSCVQFKTWERLLITSPLAACIRLGYEKSYCSGRKHPGQPQLDLFSYVMDVMCVVSSATKNNSLHCMHGMRGSLESPEGNIN